MNKKKLFLFIFIIILIILGGFIIFNKKTAKVFKIGNNMSSQEIVEYILNISSYEATVSVKVTSNKNSNKYVINQKFASKDFNCQEVLEPSNISGVKIIHDGGNLRLENTQLDLSTLFENYNYISNNCLDLNSFIEDYKSCNTSEFLEEENQIVMKTQSSERIYKTLYIDKKTHKPTKLEIKDNNQKSVIYILYNEVKVNSTNKEDVLAFKLYDFVSSI